MKRNLLFLCILAVALPMTACSKDEPSINTNYLKVLHSTLGKNYEEAVGILSVNGLRKNSEYEMGDRLIIKYLGYSKDSTYAVSGNVILKEGTVDEYDVSCVFSGKEKEEKARKILQSWSDYSYNTIFSVERNYWEARVYGDSVKTLYTDYELYCQFLDKEFSLNEHSVIEAYIGRDPTGANLTAASSKKDGDPIEYTITFGYMLSAYVVD